jgi:hypothetical protein
MSGTKATNPVSASEAKAIRRARLLEDAVAISDRFAREPVLARTGQGYYKSAGVEGLLKDIEALKKLGLND